MSEELKDTKKSIFSKEQILTIPNMLSFLRLALIPVILWLYLSGELVWAAVVIVLSSITDIVDGYIARKYKQVSDFGKFLDPLADKLLTIAAMAMFCQWGIFPAWALMIVLTREFAVSGLRMVAGPKGKVIAAGKSGKFKTASSMVGLCFLMAFPSDGILAWIVVGLIVLTTVYSGIEYFVQNWKCLWD